MSSHSVQERLVQEERKSELDAQVIEVLHRHIDHPETKKTINRLRRAVTAELLEKARTPITDESDPNAFLTMSIELASHQAEWEEQLTTTPNPGTRQILSNLISTAKYVHQSCRNAAKRVTTADDDVQAAKPTPGHQPKKKTSTPKKNKRTLDEEDFSIPSDITSIDKHLMQPLLTPEEERALLVQHNALRARWQEAQTIDPKGSAAEALHRELQEIKDHLIGSNLRLVHYLIKKFRYRPISYGDLYLAGIRGLMEALDRVDLEKMKTRLASYVRWYIHKSMLIECKKANKENNARIITLSPQLIDLQKSTLSSNVTIDEVLGKELLATIQKVLGELPRREREIVEWHMGTTSKGMTFKEIADKLGISEGRTKVIYYRALRKLCNLENNPLRAFLDETSDEENEKDA